MTSKVTPSGPRLKRWRAQRGLMRAGSVCHSVWSRPFIVRSSLLGFATALMGAGAVPPGRDGALRRLFAQRNGPP